MTGATMASVEKLQVSIETKATRDQVAAVRGVFERYGFQSEVSANYGMKSLEPSAVNYVEVGIGLFMAGFLQEAGKATFRKLQEAGSRLASFLRDLKQTRPERRNSGGLVLEGEIARISLLLPDDLPDKAMADLFALDFQRLEPAKGRRFDTIYYDTESGHWRLFMPDDPGRTLPRRLPSEKHD